MKKIVSCIITLFCVMIPINTLAQGSAAEAYAVLSFDTDNSKILTFYYDDNRGNYSPTFDIRAFASAGEVSWVDYQFDIKTVVFDNSFANYTELTSTAYWFYYINVQNIIGIENLKTSNVTNMSGMFCGCDFSNIDVSGFQTSNVTDMSDMFRECINLTSLDLSNFNTANVTNMSGMFAVCTNLATLNMSNFNTSNVTDMSNMFDNCMALTSLDLSGFNTEKVISMRMMFEYCRGLKTLNVSGFNTANVTDMGWMFNECTDLTDLDLSSFNTGNVTSMMMMFANCSSLTSLDVSGFNTDKVTEMGALFSGCTNLTSIDVSNFNTANVTGMGGMFSGYRGQSLDLGNFKTSTVTDMQNMFYSCINLSTIYVGDGWNTDKVTSGNEMFDGCTNLIGGSGTTYDANHKDYTYAHIDGGTDNPGYFTDIAEKDQVDEPYAVLTDNDDDVTTDKGTVKGKTLTFYYNNLKDANNGISVGPFINPIDNSWYEYASIITNVVFDDSFASCDTLTSTANWFYSCEKLKTIEGMGNLKTDNVTNMSSMFAFCYALTGLDVSGFKTDNVTDMSYMFVGCSSLTSLDFSDFKVDNVTDMSAMFGGCSSLTSLDLSGFNTSNVTDMSNMFDNCMALTSLDLSGFKTDNVTNLSWMFLNCSSLTSLDVSGFKTDNVTDMSLMFSHCSNLTSLDLSNFNTEKVTDMDSMFDECSNLSSLDVSGFKTDNLTSMSRLFYGCKKITSINVINWNTENVESMPFMFAECSQLDTLDISSFNTSKLKDMHNMFYMCSSLHTIYVGNTWTTEHIDNSLLDSYGHTFDGGEAVFGGCISIVGGLGTAFDEFQTESDYAHIDGGTDNPGYFTDIADKDKVDEPYAVLSENEEEITMDDGTAKGLTLTFYYDKKKETNNGLDINHGWFDQRAQITSVVFDDSFAECTSLTSLDSWFMECSNLKAITNISNLNTESVTNMYRLFYGCSNLTEIDLNGFKTGNVSDMRYMFDSCLKLTTLDLSSFETDNVINMSSMFWGCSGLTDLNVSSFRTESVSNMSFMFYGCSSLTSIDVSNFNTSNVTDMRNMFSTCTNLTTIYVGENWSTTKVTTGEDMFSGCISLVGSLGTTFNAEQMDYTFAHIDGGEDNPGYFTDKYGVTITAKSYSREYGAANPTFEYTATGAAISGTPTITCDAKDSTSVGTYPITITYTKSEGEDALNITYVKGTLTITKAPVTIKAKNASMNYGDDVPTLEVEYTGFKNNETDTVLTTKPSVTTLATKASGVGSYEISVSGADAKNYELSYEKGTLTITKAPLTITAKNDTIKRGQDLPTFEVEYSGFKNNETDTALTKKPTITCVATSDSLAGTYPIVVSGGEAKNYELKYVNGTLTITDDVVVTVKSYTRVYGDANPTFEFTSDGATLSGTPSITCAATATSPVGTYDIVIAKGDVTNSEVTYVNGTLTITKAPLTITAKSYTIKQGKDLPTLEVEYSGFKNNETDTVFTTKPVVSTTATKYSEPGSYDIIVKNAEAANYEITYVKGTLTITKKTETYDGSSNVLTVEDGGNIDDALEAIGGREEAAKSIAAIVWKSTEPLTTEMLKGLDNPNMLIYVQSKEQAPKDRNNVVINGVAKYVELTDAGTGNHNFYAPVEFVAESITYTREFKQATRKNVSRGWEGICLPFTVQTFTHESHGEIAPFGNSASNYHFWLHQFTEDGIVNAETIEANKPYLISMPNSDEYYEEFNQAGKVQFASTNVTIPVTETMAILLGDSAHIVPTFQVVEKSASVYTLNVGDSIISTLEGSVFVNNYRDVRPFEIYTFHEPNRKAGTRAISVSSLFGGGTTGIIDVMEKQNSDEVKVYSINGILIKKGNRNEVMTSLPKGLYIIGNQKVMVK